MFLEPELLLQALVGSELPKLIWPLAQHQEPQQY
jgi:hypothetical protein